MKKYISFVSAVLVLLGAAAAVRAEEGYIVTPDKVRIFYKIVGGGDETLVMVHGGPGNSLESIRPDMEPLAKGRRVIYYDQRGSGRSELITDGTRLGYQQHVADLEALREHFKLEKMTLFGNSWGGLLVSLYAIAHPDRVERAVLDVPAAPIAGFNQDMEEEISRRMAVIYKPDQLKRFRSLRQLDAWRKAKDPIAHCREVYHTMLAVYTDRSRSLDSIKLRAMSVQAGKTRSVISASRTAMRGAASVITISSPNSRPLRRPFWSSTARPMSSSSAARSSMPPATRTPASSSSKTRATSHTSKHQRFSSRQSRRF